VAGARAPVREPPTLANRRARTAELIQAKCCGSEVRRRIRGSGRLWRLGGRVGWRRGRGPRAELPLERGGKSAPGGVLGPPSRAGAATPALLFPGVLYAFSRAGALMIEGFGARTHALSGARTATRELRGCWFTRSQNAACVHRYPRSGGCRIRRGGYQKMTTPAQVRLAFRTDPRAPRRARPVESRGRCAKRPTYGRFAQRLTRSALRAGVGD
jgi:hypothetical protein